MCRRCPPVISALTPARANGRAYDHHRLSIAAAIPDHERPCSRLSALSSPTAQRTAIIFHLLSRLSLPTSGPVHGRPRQQPSAWPSLPARCRGHPCPRAAMPTAVRTHGRPCEHLSPRLPRSYLPTSVPAHGRPRQSTATIARPLPRPSHQSQPSPNPPTAATPRPMLPTAVPVHGHHQRQSPSPAEPAHGTIPTTDATHGRSRPRASPTAKPAHCQTHPRQSPHDQCQPQLLPSTTVLILGRYRPRSSSFKGVLAHGLTQPR